MSRLIAIATGLALAVALGSAVTACAKKKDNESAEKQAPAAAATPVAPATEPAAKPVKPVPEGYFSVTPMLVVDDVDAAIAFYESVLGAKKRSVMPGPDGKPVHAEIQIGDSVIMLGPEMPEAGSKSPKTLGGTNGSMVVYVEDVDKVFAAALAAGATQEMPVMDGFWGDRYGGITDPFGHSWGIATHKEDVSPEQMDERVQAFAKDPKSVAAVVAKNPGTPATSTTSPEYHTVTASFTLTRGVEAIDFYKAALGATERMRSAMPDGSLMHAEIQIGDSVIMLGDENPMMPSHKSAKSLGGAPVSAMIYVEDADKLYAQAVAAGAAEKEKMSDMFWGDRFGMVTDPNGNEWAVATRKENLTPAQMDERMKKAMSAGGDHGVGGGPKDPGPAPTTK